MPLQKHMQAISTRRNPAIYLKTARRVFASLVIFIFFMMPAERIVSCQVIAQTLTEKLEFTVTNQVDVAKPGEKIPLDLTFPSPTPYELKISLSFPTFCGGVPLQGEDVIPANSREFEFAIKIPDKIESGDCQITALQFAKNKQDNNVITQPNPPFSLPTPIKFKVAGLPVVQDSFPLPIGVVLNQDQRQFFRAKSLVFTEIRNDLLDDVDGHEIPGPTLWDELLLTLGEGSKELIKTETEYRSKFHEIPDNEQILFTDLQRRYDAEMKDIIALRKNLRQTKTVAGTERLSPVLWQAKQLHPRTQIPPEAESRNKNLSGTKPPEVEGVLYLLYWTASAFNKIADHGKSAFRLSIQTIPEGADVYEKRAGEEYKLIPHPTNIPEAEFPFADWTFKFVRQGCMQIRDFDPVSYSLDTLVAEINCKSR